MAIGGAVQAESRMTGSGATKSHPELLDGEVTPIMVDYSKYDGVLYGFANALLDYDLLSHPDCRYPDKQIESSQAHVYRVHMRSMVIGWTAMTPRRYSGERR